MVINRDVYNGGNSTSKKKIDRELEGIINKYFEEVQTTEEERRENLTLTLARNAQQYSVIFPDSVEFTLKNPEFDHYKYNPLAVWHRLRYVSLRLNQERGYNLNVVLKEKPALLFEVILKEYAKQRQISLEHLKRSRIKVTVIYNIVEDENNREEYFFKVGANDKDPVKIKYKYTGVSKYNMRQKLLREADYLRATGYNLFFLFEKYK